MFAYVIWVQVTKEARVSNAMELEFQAVVSHLPWVLGNKLGYSVRAAITLNL